MIQEKTTNKDYQKRKENLSQLAAYIRQNPFKEEFINAYIDDTSFIYTHTLKREIETPAALLTLTRTDENALAQRKALGKVAVLIPNNSLGLTVAKAIASSYLMGNETIVHFPSRLVKTTPLYTKLLHTFLPDIEVAPVSQSSADFLLSCLKDSQIKAVVIYGDDAWIDSYRDLAEETETKLIFEGPGNDPMIIMPDADVEAAVDGAISCGLNNGGQSCSAFERFFVHESTEEIFSLRLIDKLRSLKMGNVKESTTDIGPVASKLVLNRILAQLEDAVSQGAHLKYGGNVVTDTHSGLPVIIPAVLTNCLQSMSVVEKETFGPVFPLIKFSSMDDLLPALDDTNYGLNASVYGTPYPLLMDHLINSHRNVYENSTCVSRENIESRIIDGGFKRSGFIWEKKNNDYITRMGSRNLVHELSNH